MHIYHKDGKDYPSVTTILHSLGSEDLMRWANVMGFKHQKYEDIMDRTSNWGTLVHSHMQEIVDPEHASPLLPKDGIEEFNLLQIKSKFSRYISNFTYQTIFTEHTLISEKLGYAGTLDWYAIINGYKMLNDFKTSKAVRVHMLFQLGGYRNLLVDCLGEHPDGASIILVNDQICRLNPFNRYDLDFFGDVFQSLAEFYLKSYQVKVSPDKDFLAKLTTR